MACITSIFSKVFELVILKRHSHLFDTTDNQFGFKRAHGTELSIFVLKQVIEFYSTNGSPLYICFLDLSKAFDKVNHVLLFQKLLKRQVPVLVVRLLQQWYCSQMFVIRWGNVFSSPFSVSNGVRQGGILSPILFNVFMDDLSCTLRGALFGCHINGECYNHIIYADDTVLVASSPTALQNLLDISVTYFTEHKLLINRRKTKCMTVFPSGMAKLTVPTFFIDESPITVVDQQCYLGVLLNSACSDNADIKTQIRSLYVRGNMILQKFKHCSDEVKGQLFRNYCTSFYCLSLWTTFNRTTLEDLKVAYNNVFRFLFKLPRRGSVSYHFVTKGLPTFSFIRRNLCYSMFKRILSSSNCLVSNIVDCISFASSSVFLEWINVLF